MKKVLSISLVLVVLIAFVISCEDFGLSRVGDYSEPDLIEIAMFGMDIAHESIYFSTFDSQAISKMITVDGDIETRVEVKWKNFDFEKAVESIDEEWNFDSTLIIKSGRASINAQAETMNFDFTYEVTGEDLSDYPGTFRIAGNVLASGTVSLKVNGRKVDSFNIAP